MLNASIITGFADEIDSSFDVQLDVLNELGQKYIELRAADGVGIADFTMDKAKEIKEKMDANKVRISAIGSPIGKIGINDDFMPHMEKYKHVVELAHYFNTPNIRMFSFYLPDEKKPELYRNEVMERMGRLVDYAKSEGIILLHENEKGIYGAMAKECLDLMNEFYGDNFKCIFDFANYVQCKQDTKKAYELLKDYISYIHVKDAVWETGEVVIPGTGDGNLQYVFNELDKKGFCGFLSLEPHLFHFQGFDALEKGETGNKKESDGVRAYKAAYAGLKRILQ